MDITLSPELRHSFEVAFRGCGTTLEDELASPVFLRFYEKELLAEPRATGDYLKMMSNVYMLCDKEKDASDLPQYQTWLHAQSDNDLVDPAVSALMRHLGHVILHATRKHVLTNEMRALAREWRNVRRATKEDAGHIAKLNQLLVQHNHTFTPEEEEDGDAEDLWMRQCLQSTKWWVEDRSSQQPEKFLPIYLGEGGQRPNCHGQSILACAFAAEAGVPYYRTNLIRGGSDQLRRTATASMGKLLTHIQASGVSDVSQWQKYIVQEQVRDAFREMAQVDFHSGALMEYGDADVIIDPYGHATYWVDKEDGYVRLAKFIATKHGGVHFPTSNLSLHKHRATCVEESLQEWLDFLTEWFPILTDLTTKPKAEVIAALPQMILDVQKTNFRVAGFGAERFDDITPEELTEMAQPFMADAEESEVQEIIDSMILLCIHFLTEHYEIIDKELNARESAHPPLSCEYGEAEYGIGLTTVQSIGVLEGYGLSFARELVRYGCDQSLLYLLAEHGEETDLDTTLARALLRALSPHMLHAACAQLLVALEEEATMSQKEKALA